MDLDNIQILVLYQRVKSGLSILHQEVLVGKRKSIAYSHLRGGNCLQQMKANIPDTILVLEWFLPSFHLSVVYCIQSKTH